MHSYTVAKKIEVIRWHGEHGKNVHQTSRQFKLDRKRIGDEEFRQSPAAKLRRKLSNGVPVFSEYVNDALFEFLERETVSNRLLSEEAVKIANSMHLRKQ
ncbi:hypothetical protein HPB48_016665 [Haemaphysalis longicornis]|uniref:Uncharacterized protein n=1 Tax=Haemaphysalis longicornis TaxID=44386 RepID=A0A9J6GC18_HAELO|nr:hypothetical protein HPB48_016665 [Haemaphysalis longicornis]